MKFKIGTEVSHDDIQSLVDDKLVKFNKSENTIKLKKSDITWLGGGYGIWDCYHNYLIIYDDYIIGVHMYSYDLVYRMMEDFDMLIVYEDGNINIYGQGELV